MKVISKCEVICAHTSIKLLLIDCIYKKMIAGHLKPVMRIKFVVLNFELDDECTTSVYLFESQFPDV